MKNLLLIVACIAIVIGILCGGLIVWSLSIWRRNQVVDSLISTNDVVGLIGTVVVSFNHKSNGKVQLNVKGSTVDFIAFTDEHREFAKGDKIFVVGVKQNKVLVVSESSLRNFLDS